ncbi:hypothetical protein F8388_007313 [Cannabis sativa]|uniref:Protein kinase domain-containing protein n=1 Tax=Cannabis sativa TaxID=3483 RepID=A0A7J6FHJ1_CANSA|nr:hypothetical protein F8388_007313 [Cannabis sativa]
MDSSKLTDSQSIMSLSLVTRVEESFRDDNNKFVRADTINLRTFGVELEKMKYNVSWSKELKLQKKEEWGIELFKLKLIREIAKGTYGIVYKGVYDGQDVAVKILDWGEGGMTCRTASLRASFQQEVSVWHKLDHPNVTKFIGASMGISKLEVPSTNSLNGCQVSYISNACCVLAEYLPGGTLKNYLFKNRRTKLAFKIVIQLALDMARGLNQRPKIPRCCPKSYARIMKKCWDANPEKRPDMTDVVKLLEAIDTSKGGGMIPEDQAPGCFYFGTPRGP